MGKTYPDDVLKFLKQSNYIEGEDSNIAQPLVAWDYINQHDKLSHGVICKAHKYLMIDKPYPPPLGYYRSLPQINVTIGGELKPWNMVEPLMDNWLLDYKKLGWKEAHIRFEHAHPFVDGNGRIGRIIMNWQRLQEGLPILVIHESERFEYYKWFKLPEALSSQKGIE